ncbi:MAG TPA: DVU0150 family protein [Bryobacteraceae bacterium]|nr:DVU0150 family protein [Bryobacteraceae bacterium]
MNLIRTIFLILAGALTLTAEPMVLVADSRRYAAWEAWWADLYNGSHFWFALATIVTLPLLSLLMGKITDFFLARIGIDLKSRVLAEH